MIRGAQERGASPKVGPVISSRSGVMGNGFNPETGPGMTLCSQDAKRRRSQG